MEQLPEHETLDELRVLLYPAGRIACLLPGLSRECSAGIFRAEAVPVGRPGMEPREDH